MRSIKYKVPIRLSIALIPASLFLAPATTFAGKVCGSGDDSYTTSIDLGCAGSGTAMVDLAFAAIRFLSIGVGLVIVASMVYAGIQYSASRGDPNAHALAVKRIQANVIALLMFIFAFAIINYLVPGEFLK
jgi:hypothetical protein